MWPEELYLHNQCAAERCVWAASPSSHWWLLVCWDPPPPAQSGSDGCPGNTLSHEAGPVACMLQAHPPGEHEYTVSMQKNNVNIFSWMVQLFYELCVSTETLELWLVSSASRLWIMFQGAMPMATTRTLVDVLAREWSLTAWPKCLVMPKRRPLVRIHAPGEQRGSCMCVCVWGQFLCTW